MNMMDRQGLTEEVSIQYRWWWGLLGCAALMGVVILVGPYSAAIEFLPDQGASWYYWKLPEADPWAQLTSWVGYLCHQLAMWAIIYYAIQARPAYSKTLHGFNLLAMAVNGVFVLLHILQTKFFYDGLAQDTSIFSSFGSVVVMLFMIFIMENKRRGLVFGRKVSFLSSVGDNLKHYHGYYFSWAIIYTFWYHPIEITIGHLAGTFYTIMLMLQGSLFFTRFHTNRWWTVSLEVLFSVHGALVAYFMSKTGASASMFLLTGLGAFTITQMYGLPLTRLQRRLIMAFTLAAFVVFGLLETAEAQRLPIVLGVRYIGILVLALLLMLLTWIFLWFNRRIKVKD